MKILLLNDNPVVNKLIPDSKCARFIKYRSMYFDNKLLLGISGTLSELNALEGMHC